MKNKLSDLNNHLFAQLERLSDEDIPIEQLESEIERTKAVTCIARELLNVGRLALDARKAQINGEIGAMPELLGLTDERS